MRGKAGITFYDPGRGVTRVLLPAEEADILDATPDGRTLLVQREVLDSEVWLLTALPPAP